jgi:hypothetical protein
MCLVLTDEDSSTLDMTFVLEGLGSYDGRSVFGYEVLKEFYLFYHRFVCEMISGSHV